MCETQSRYWLSYLPGIAIQKRKNYFAEKKIHTTSIGKYLESLLLI